MDVPGNRATAETLELLRGIEALRELAASSLAKLAQTATIETVEAGTALMAEGDDGTDAYFVITGKLEVLVEERDGTHTIVAELGPGEVVGDMALLTGAPRSATVRARRESVVVRIERAICMRIAGEDPGFLVDLARTLVGRLDRSIHHAEPRRPTSVIAILPAGGSADIDEFVSAFAAVLRLDRSIAVFGPGAFAGSAEPRDAGRQLAVLLQRAESSHDLTVLVADGLDDDWTQLCARQADRLLLVGSASGLTEWSPAERALEQISLERIEAQRHLVILQNTATPSATASLLHRRSVDRHHHVRMGLQGHLARLARSVTGTSVGVVLSGGGARGFAHFGVIKALEEAGVPIDHVGGTSIGGSIAGVYAAGWDWETMLARERYATVGQGSMVDLSLPMVALGRGQRLTHGIRQGFGGLDISDLWLDFFCVSTDLTSGLPRVHTTGPVWRAVRASVSIPGVLPPVRDDDGHVLVDGSVVDNLPVGVMRKTFEPATVIAVDVRGSVTLRSADLPDDGVVSGWRVAANRIFPRQRSLELPGIVELLSAVSAIDANGQAENADLLLTPPVRPFGVLDFAANERIVDVGHRYAEEIIRTWDTLPGSVPAPDVSAAP